MRMERRGARFCEIGGKKREQRWGGGGGALARPRARAVSSTRPRRSLANVLFWGKGVGGGPRTGHHDPRAGWMGRRWGHRRPSLHRTRGRTRLQHPGREHGGRRKAKKKHDAGSTNPPEQRPKHTQTGTPGDPKATFYKTWQKRREGWFFSEKKGGAGGSGRKRLSLSWRSRALAPPPFLFLFFWAQAVVVVG